MRGEPGDLRGHDPLVFDAPTVRVIIADKAARAVDTADGVEVGLARGELLIEILGVLHFGDAQPVVAGAAIDAVSVDVVDRVPSKSNARRLVDRLGELRSVHTQIGVLPAGGIVLADKIALCVNTANRVGVGAVFAHVGVGIGGVGGFRHLSPSVFSALVIDAVAGGGVIDRVLHRVPAELNALGGALQRGDRGGL